MLRARVGALHRTGDLRNRRRPGMYRQQSRVAGRAQERRLPTQHDESVHPKPRRRRRVVPRLLRAVSCRHLLIRGLAVRRVHV